MAKLQPLPQPKKTKPKPQATPLNTTIEIFPIVVFCFINRAILWWLASSISLHLPHDPWRRTWTWGSSPLPPQTYRVLPTAPSIDQMPLVRKILPFLIIVGSLSGATPNVVIIMGDDWSWPHASILGDKTVKTPNFDRIAREGVLFEYAFTPAPSCTPSRHAVVSGQYHWRLGEGVNLGGSIPKKTSVYPDFLAQRGYQTGFCRKGTSPSKLTFRGNDPFGKRFKNFNEFIGHIDPAAPFCFWYGAGEPHRPYKWQGSLKSSLDLTSIEVPSYLPNNETIRTDLGDYYLKVQKLDELAGQILQKLTDLRELENTIVIMTGDNGMPFPRAKATLYDSGTRVPLAIRWGKNIPPGRSISDFVSLTDLAPTILEACGLPSPDSMTGRSLLPLLISEKSGLIDSSRDFVLTGMERHVYPNPSRALRTKDYLYIINYDPAEWPTGLVSNKKPIYDFLKSPWPTEKGAFSYNIDPSPSKQWMRHHSSPQNSYSFQKRPSEELYDLKKDPHQLLNLLLNEKRPPEIETIRRTLNKRLSRLLRESRDPRTP